MALNLNIDLDKIPTTGAGLGTSKQLWNSSLTGVEASCALAQEDVERMKSYKNSILSVGRDTGIDPAIIAAIISRETRAGHFLQADGWNSGHKAFGIMQDSKGPGSAVLVSGVYRVESWTARYRCSSVGSASCLLFWALLDGLYPADRPVGLKAGDRPVGLNAVARVMAGRRRNRLEVTRSP
uniref:Uncharacterized protein n=1 Tax=Astyanax mexicanus TaxID=7994 RepID=A0A3B1K7Z8_ASTMX